MTTDATAWEMMAEGRRGETQARIWDTHTWQPRVVLTSDTAKLNDLAITPDGKWLATAYGDGTVKVLDTDAYQIQAIMRVESPVHTCAWLNGGGLAFGGPGGLYIFDFLAANTQSSKNNPTHSESPR
jgi:WD40 repeat protein